VAQPADPSLDRLLELDGVVLVISADGMYWVKFAVKRVPPTASKPHGLDYSLTLHGPGNKRLVGFDNDHPVPPTKWGEPQDHRHRRGASKPYAYSDAAALLAAFWAEVDTVLRERGAVR
jgi:hypothetical protein